MGNPPVRKTSLLSEEAKLKVTDELIRWFGITVSKLSAMIYEGIMTSIEAPTGIGMSTKIVNK